MKRVLVLNNEAARHPFRRSLPPSRIEPLPAREPMTHAAFFFASFISGFIIFYGMIA
jgi:hypothetical protein